MSTVTRVARREIGALLRRAAAAADVGGVSDHDLLALFRQSPLAEQLVDQAEAARQNQREELVAAEKRERASADGDCAALRKEWEGAEAGSPGKRAEIKALELTADRAKNRHAARDLQANYTIASIHAQLERLAPRALTEFIARHRAEADRLRRDGFELVGVNLGDEATVQRNAEKNLRVEGHELIADEAVKLMHTAIDGEALASALEKLDASVLELGKVARDARNPASAATTARVLSREERSEANRRYGGQERNI